MKAAQLTKYGGFEAISIVDMPAPQLTPDKILVETYAAGVNPSEWKIQTGLYRNFMKVEFPITLGGDFAGVVIETGNNVIGFKKGDAVFGQASVFSGNSGSFAEFTLTDPGLTAIKPNKLDFISAGALPLTGISAVMAINELTNLQSRQKILIHGGAGGIGTIAIQIAKYIGAYVATTVSENDMDYVKQLGADLIIDYKNQKFESLVNDFDAVFDTVGGDTTNRSIQILKSGGILVSMLQPADEQLARKQNVKTVVQQSRATPERLQKLVDYVEHDAITVHVEKTFPLEQTAEALDYLQKLPPRGKVVIVIK